MNQAGFLLPALAAMAISLSACVVAPTSRPDYIEPVLVAPPPPRVEYVGPPPITGHGTGVACATNGALAIGLRPVPAIDGFLTAGSARVITGSSMVAAGTGVEPIRTYLPTLLLSFICTGCAVVTVADAAVTVLQHP